MGAAFIITLREGLEGVLIVAIVMAYLRQLGKHDQFPIVVGAAAAGVAVSIVAGAGVYAAVGELQGRAEQLTEGIIALVAVAVLTWMVFWMRRQARTLGGHVRGQVDHALAGGAALGLASIVFVGIVREGLETALFMLTVLFDSGAASAVIGAIAGLALAVVLGYGVYRGGQFINLRLFFQITAGFIILFAAGLFGRGVHELQEAGALASMRSPLWDISSNTVVGHGKFSDFLEGLFGWSAAPSVEQVVVWALYLATACWFYYFGRMPPLLANRAKQWFGSVARPLSSLVRRFVAREAKASVIPDP